MSASTSTPSQYAAVADMIERYGEAELIRDTTPAGREGDTINVVRVNQALVDASDLIDSHLRRRYAVPLFTVPSQILRACCTIARADLANNGIGQPTKPQIAARKEVVDWLTEVCEGRVMLDGQIPMSSDQSFARATDRPRMNVWSRRQWGGF